MVGCIWMCAVWPGQAGYPSKHADVAERKGGISPAGRRVGVQHARLRVEAFIIALSWNRPPESSRVGEPRIPRLSQSVGRWVGLPVG